MPKLGTRLAISAALLTLLAAIAWGPPQDEASPRVVTSEWVTERLEGDDLVLLHSKPRRHTDLRCDR